MRCVNPLAFKLVLYLNAVVCFVMSVGDHLSRARSYGVVDGLPILCGASATKLGVLLFTG